MLVVSWVNVVFFGVMIVVYLMFGFVYNFVVKVFYMVGFVVVFGFVEYCWYCNYLLGDIWLFYVQGVFIVIVVVMQMVLFENVFELNEVVFYCFFVFLIGMFIVFRVWVFVVGGVLYFYFVSVVVWYFDFLD